MVDRFLREGARLQAQQNPARQAVVDGVAMSLAVALISLTLPLLFSDSWPPASQLGIQFVIVASVVGILMATTIARRKPDEALPPGTDLPRLRAAQRVIRDRAPGHDPATNALAKQLAQEALAGGRWKFETGFSAAVVSMNGLLAVMAWHEGAGHQAAAYTVVALVLLHSSVGYYAKHRRLRNATAFDKVPLPGGNTESRASF